MSYKLLLVKDDAELREIITDYFIEKNGKSLEDSVKRQQML